MERTVQDAGRQEVADERKEARVAGDEEWFDSRRIEETLQWIEAHIDLLDEEEQGRGCCGLFGFGPRRRVRALDVEGLEYDDEFTLDAQEGQPVPGAEGLENDDDFTLDLRALAARGPPGARITTV